MIHIDNCSVTFGRGTPNQVQALDRVSFEVAAREFVVMIGTNGSGKSTLMNVIAGGVSPDDGRIFIDGDDVTPLPGHRRARYIGRVFQNPFSGTAPSIGGAGGMFRSPTKSVQPNTSRAPCTTATMRNTRPAISRSLRSLGA